MLGMSLTRASLPRASKGAGASGKMVTRKAFGGGGGGGGGAASGVGRRKQIIRSKKALRQQRKKKLAEQKRSSDDDSSSDSDNDDQQQYNYDDDAADDSSNYDDVYGRITQFTGSQDDAADDDDDAAAPAADDSDDDDDDHDQDTATTDTSADDHKFDVAELTAQAEQYRTPAHWFTFERKNGITLMNVRVALPSVSASNVTFEVSSTHILVHSLAAKNKLFLLYVAALALLSYRSIDWPLTLSLSVSRDVGACSKPFPHNVRVQVQIDGAEVEASFSSGFLTTTLLVVSSDIPRYLFKMGKKGAKAPDKGLDKKTALELKAKMNENKKLEKKQQQKPAAAGMCARALARCWVLLVHACMISNECSWSKAKARGHHRAAP